MDHIAINSGEIEWAARLTGKLVGWLAGGQASGWSVGVCKLLQRAVFEQKQLLGSHARTLRVHGQA